jgi:hypothetical protein
MVQGLPARVPAQAKAKAKVEAEWADHSPQARVVIVSVQTAATRLLMLPGSLVMQKAVRNVVQK